MKFSGHIALTQPKRAKGLKVGSLRAMKGAKRSRPSQVSRLGGGIGGIKKGKHIP